MPQRNDEIDRLRRSHPLIRIPFIAVFGLWAGHVRQPGRGRSFLRFPGTQNNLNRQRYRTRYTFAHGFEKDFARQQTDDMPHERRGKRPREPSRRLLRCRAARDEQCRETHGK